MLGGLGALLVLAFVFGSFLAIVPIMMAMASIMTTFLVVWGLTTITEVSPIVQFLIALIGLGVSIDYSLLVVVRWREERAHGLSGDAAIERAMQTAGRAVVFSGTTVAIGLFALVALPRAVPALGRLRRHADPADQRDRRADAAAGGAQQARAAPGLAARPQRRQAPAARGPAGRTWSCAPLGGGAWRGAGARRAGARGDQPPAGHLQRQHDRQGRRRQAAACSQLERSGIGSGVLVPARGAGQPARPRPNRWRSTLAAVPGVHGAVAPELGELAPYGRRRSSTSSRPQTPPPPKAATRSIA